MFGIIGETKMIRKISLIEYQQKLSKFLSFQLGRQSLFLTRMETEKKKAHPQRVKKRKEKKDKKKK